MSSTQLPAASIKPPRAQTNAVDWLRRNLFNSWLNSIVTIVLLIAIPLVLWNILTWIFTGATWTAVAANLRLFMVGLYPPDQIWRVQVCVGLIMLLTGLSAGIWGGIVRAIAGGLVLVSIFLALLPLGWGPQLFWGEMAGLIALGYLLGRYLPNPLRWPTIVAWLIVPFLSLLLIRGGFAGLPLVGTNFWGGLMLTIILAVFPIVFSFPLGVLLALGRRSRLPLVKAFCVVYIEVIRGVPLVTVLFMGSLLLPLFINATPDALIRAIVALTLFSAAYLAENVRGGLQAVPNGQVEAAKALGLNVFQYTLLIVLPQALRAVIPAIVGQFISLFKDTSLVTIVGLTEMLGMAVVVWNQQAWLTVAGGVQRESLLFVALIYWVFCFTMFQVSRRIEQNLGVGTR